MNMRILFLLCTFLFSACPKAEGPAPKEPIPLSQNNSNPIPQSASNPTPASTVTVTPASTATSKPTPTPATKPSKKPPSEELTTYIACGCGCCGGSKPRQEICVYRSKGESLEKIREQDQKSAQNPRCAAMGCSLGTKYKYCD